MVDFGMDPIYIKDFVVIAMAGYFTAIGKAPLTAIILVTEMVGSLNHLMPLGLAALVAYIVNDLLGGNPIYESLLERLLETIRPPLLKAQGQLLISSNGREFFRRINGTGLQLA